jgi:hypothetical protein
VNNLVRFGSDLDPSWHQNLTKVENKTTYVLDAFGEPLVSENARKFDTKLVPKWGWKCLEKGFETKVAKV